jgi:Predicted membrane protein (DUF2157)
MEKQQIISFISTQIQSGKISKDDLYSIASGESASVIQDSTTNKKPTSAGVDSSRNLMHILYAIGAIIAVVGVIILIVQNWKEIGFIGRVLVTVVLALSAYISGTVLRSKEHRVISEVMFTISAALSPVGAYVLLSEANIDFTQVVNIWISVVLTVLFGVALLISKRNILILITLGFATSTYYTTLIKFLSIGSVTNSDDILKWATILIGIAYILIALALKSLFLPQDQSEEKEKNAVMKLINTLGFFGVLFGGIMVGGIFDIFFILIIFGAFYASVYLKSTSVLALSAVFLVAHIIKLTSKYFVNVIGWSLALIVVGFLIIGIGYATYSLNKKFISSKP